MTNIVWKRPDGGVSVTHLTPASLAEGNTPEQEALRLKERGDIPREYELAAVHAQIPQDRSFRDAWHYDGENVGIDMGQARDIHKNRLREKRKGLFAALDAEYMKADEMGDTAKKQAVAAKKQALRDITQHPEIEAAATPAALKTAAISAFGANGA
jgi:hypothetical protein